MQCEEFVNEGDLLERNAEIKASECKINQARCDMTFYDPSAF